VPLDQDFSCWGQDEQRLDHGLRSEVSKWRVNQIQAHYLSISL
jgi:hypothetical protein